MDDAINPTVTGQAELDRDGKIRNREYAGRMLAARLLHFRDDPKAMVLAVPPGGVAVGHAISQVLHLPLEVLIVRKVCAPGNPAYALGAVTEVGSLFFNRNATETMSAFAFPRSELDPAIKAHREEIAHRQASYRGSSLPTLKDWKVILVDEGVITGTTLSASIAALRQVGVSHLAVAVPIGPEDVLREISMEVDELVVLLTPKPYSEPQHHYREFPPVSDEDVVRYLSEAPSIRRRADQPAPLRS